MKKLFTFLILVMCLLFFVSCGGSGNNNSSVDSVINGETSGDSTTESDTGAENDSNADNEIETEINSDADTESNSSNTDISSDIASDVPVHVHIEQIIPAVAPTCTETGLTAGKKCSTCGEVLVAQEIVNVFGHTYENNYTCTICQETLTTSEGLEFSLSDDGTYYSITGIGDCTDLNIIIPYTYNDLPVGVAPLQFRSLRFRQQHQ